MSLDSLPSEVICLVASYLPWYRHIFSLLRCNRIIHDAVIHAIYKQDTRTRNDVLQWLLQRGFESNIQHIISRNNLDLNIPINTRYTLINTPLLLAVGFGRTNIVEILLRNGAQVNIGTDISALGYAAALGDYNMSRLLLQHGAHVDIADTLRGISPLQCALARGYPNYDRSGRQSWQQYWEYKEDDEAISVVKLLLAHGAHPQFQFNFNLSTGLHNIPRGQWKSTKELFSLCLDSGADLDAQDLDGDTPLHVALHCYAFYGYLEARTEFVRLLLESGADPNTQDSQGNTPLHIALGHQTEKVPKVPKESVRLLLASGADVNLRNHKGVRPLGAKFESPDIFKLVFKPGASTRYRGKPGNKIIWKLLRTRNQMKAVKQYVINEALIALLLEQGAYEDQTIDGECPRNLSVASVAKKYPLLKDLMSKKKPVARKWELPPSSCLRVSKSKLKRPS
ncbi:uncharacterized protein N7518_004897 [Penicillium psychrosexuale]|uniref:uncharacterized protein n=1 Tax=Penicillium psychrosexuale TaxID=1002107 RepID=UPI002545316C|nr:uncharacterized protein N7518_004897 [Penicillium psychrosexuale]KAJ5796357.1 hypothetical protein N7518_004897 [Penicillium psychrosexuale]